MISLKLSGIDMTMELDTGAAVSVIREETYRDKLGRLPLQHTNILLNTYSGERLPVLGQLSVNIQYKHQEEELPLYVIKGCAWQGMTKQDPTRLEVHLEHYNKLRRFVT